MLRKVSATRRVTHTMSWRRRCALLRGVASGFLPRSASTPPRRSPPDRNPYPRRGHSAHHNGVWGRLEARVCWRSRWAMRQGELRDYVERRPVARAPPGGAKQRDAHLDNQQMISLPRHARVTLPEAAEVPSMHCCERSAGASGLAGSGRHPCQPHRSGTRWAAMGGAPASARSIFHALRHTAATLALEDGISPQLRGRDAGHASVATTLGVYAHVTHVSLDALTGRSIPATTPVSISGSSAARQRHV